MSAATIAGGSLGSGVIRRGVEVRAGFIPLVDCAALVIAAVKGFDVKEGFSLRLSREASWANIRDKVAFGAFDCAHMIAPMPIASALGLTPSAEPIITPMALNRGGSAITVSAALFAEMAGLAPGDATAGGLVAARALALVVRGRREKGAAPLTLGMVYPFSSHHFDLRYWLADGGIDPDEDVNLVVIPPPLLAESLARNRVDGFCVGSPWGSVAVEESGARIVATKSEIWPMGPEKVLGMREAWADANAELLGAVIRALAAAAMWLDDKSNHDEAARLLAEPTAIGVPANLILRALQGRLVRGPGGAPDDDPRFLAFHRNGAGVPWRHHALWLMAQMIRWGLVREPFGLDAVAQRTFRPDLYQAAVGQPGGDLAETDADPKSLAASITDGRSAIASIAQFGSRSRHGDLAPFAALNS